MPLIQDLNPYLEFSVVDSAIEKSKIFEEIRQKVNNIGLSDNNVIFKDDGIVLRLDFKSLADFKKMYTRDKKIYETLNELIQNDNRLAIKFSDLQDSIQKYRESCQKKMRQKSGIFATLKYTTNFKEIIRKNYKHTFEIIEAFGIEASYEEINDGFLLFYSTKADFEMAHLDLEKFQSIKKWLKSKKLWVKSFEALFNAHPYLASIQ